MGRRIVQETFESNRKMMSCLQDVGDVGYGAIILEEHPDKVISDMVGWVMMSSRLT